MIFFAFMVFMVVVVPLLEADRKREMKKAREKWRKNKNSPPERTDGEQEPMA